MSEICTRPRARRAVLAWAFAALFPLCAPAAERGFPLLTVYPPETHKAGPQTFDVAQDRRGILYFGNLHGLLTWDGAWWRLMKLPDEQVALSLAADAAGTVAIGMVNDLGFLGRDASGAQAFRSLLPQLPAGERAFGDVRDLCTSPAGFLYVTETSVILWNGREARVAAKFDREAAPRGCHAEQSYAWLIGPKGMQRLDLESLALTKGPIDRHVDALVRRADGTLLAAVRDEGLFVVDGDKATPFASAASAWIKKDVARGGVLLRDGRMVLASRRSGVVIVDPAGNIEQEIHDEAGLPDAVILDLFVDREGAVWLAMEGPLVRIDVGAPVTVFDARRGLKGGVGDVARFRGRLYATSSHGLYSIDQHGAIARVEGLREGAWRLLALEDVLLIGTSKGVYQMREGGVPEQILAVEGEMYDLHRSAADPSRVWIAIRNGIGSLRRDGAKWQYEGVLPGAPEYISSIIEKDGVIWAGSAFDGVVRVDEPRSPQQRVRTFGKGEMNVYDIGGRIVLVQATGAALQVGAGGELEPDAVFGHVKTPRGFFAMVRDARGDVWINSTPPRVYERRANGQYAREGKPLVSVSAADIQTLRAHADGTVWFAADKGLFRYEPAASSDVAAAQPTPLIRRVVAGENQVLHDEASEKQTPVELRHDFGRIRIEFAPASYRPGVEYQYRLDPIDEHWSSWTPETFIDYTTLGASDYTFRLRARGPATQPSGEARWSFTVLAPWYRTRWAYALWAFLIAAAILLIIGARTRSLQRQAAVLRAKVDEQTGELQQTVQLLEQANTRLEALSLEDDLTGIANRRYFERSLSDEWNRARRRETPLALILLDLDHFKDLNDRRGHPAGDECLRRVGGFLAETVRRSGEVVARYGGEEFAILLPGVDAAGAIVVAESLRAGIERLGIHYGNGSSKLVSASCGVAAMTPTGEATPEALVASADRALYAAKHSGRNCVRVADESTTGTWLRDVSA